MWRRQKIPAAPWKAWRIEALRPGSYTLVGERRPWGSDPYQLPRDHLSHHQTPRCTTEAVKTTKLVTTLPDVDELEPKGAVSVLLGHI